MTVRGVFAFLALVGASGPVAAQTPLEQQVLAAINSARADPAAYLRTLRTFRGYFHASTYTLPGSREVNATEEGVGAVDDAIAFLAQQSAVPPVGAAVLLNAAAADHATEQAGDGGTGHESSDGASPGDRVRRRGGGDYVAEVIEYGAVDAVDAVRQLIVDDGVADRGHRTVLFDPRLRFAGVSCGHHPQYRTMCVIDLGVTSDGHELGRLNTADAGRTMRFGGL